MFEPQRIDLEQLDAASRRRKLSPRTGRDFSSNDYLGLAGSLDLAAAARSALNRGVPIGSGGSRLLRGNHEEHEMLEREAAAFFGCESALYFPTGYAANSALISTLPQRGDLVIYDELAHASTREGLKLGRAQQQSFPHNDATAVEVLARNWMDANPRSRIWIVVESLYSMNGDKAPLDDLIVIADKFQAILIVDEAHATGVFGEHGRGLAAHLEGRENVITMRTCGKALGCEGALICGSRIVRDFLINRGRGFIFSTAPSPLMAAMVRASLKIIRDQPQRRLRLWLQVTHAEQILKSIGLKASGTQIIPLIIGKDARTMEIAGELQGAGFDVRGIRPPTVPAGTSRLRLSITLNSTNADLDQLGCRLKAIMPAGEAA